MTVGQTNEVGAAADVGVRLKALFDEIDQILKNDFEGAAGTDIRFGNLSLTRQINTVLDSARTKLAEKTETARLQQETIDNLSKSQEEVNNLRTLSSAIALAQTRDEIVGQLLAMIRENVFPFGAAALYQGSDEIGFNLVDAWEATDADKAEITRQQKAGFLDWVVRSHAPMAMPAEGRFPAAIYVPMKVGNRVTGIFLLLSERDVDEFTQSDQERISLLCSQAAVALENARLVEQILQMKQYNENILLSLTNGLVAVNLEGVVTTLNPAGLQILNLTGPDIIGRTFEQIPKLEPFARMLMETVTTGGEPKQGEVHLVEGEKKQILGLSTSPIMAEGDTVLGAIGVFSDLTPIKLLEQQVRRSDRLAVVGTLAAGAAHEIRNPLSAIRGTIQLMNRKIQKILEAQPLLEKTKSIVEEVDRINRIVGGMMELSKEGKLQLIPSPINKLLRDVAALVEGNYKEAGVGLDLQLDESVPDVAVDVSEMKQVLLNLYQNALQAMKTNGKLSVTSVLTQDANGVPVVQIQIADSGCGIPKTHLEKIFAPFFTTKSDGTGLGLSIVHRIVEEHKGRITVDSVEGQGTTFTIWLPPAKTDSNKETAKPNA